MADPTGHLPVDLESLQAEIQRVLRQLQRLKEGEEGRTGEGEGEGEGEGGEDEGGEADGFPSFRRRRRPPPSSNGRRGVRGRAKSLRSVSSLPSPSPVPSPSVSAVALDDEIAEVERQLAAEYSRQYAEALQSPEEVTREMERIHEEMERIARGGADNREHDRDTNDRNTARGRRGGTSKGETTAWGPHANPLMRAQKKRRRTSLNEEEVEENKRTKEEEEGEEVGGGEERKREEEEEEEEEVYGDVGVGAVGSRPTEEEGTGGGMTEETEAATTGVTPSPPPSAPRGRGRGGRVKGLQRRGRRRK